MLSLSNYDHLVFLAFDRSTLCVLEPIVRLEVTTPSEFESSVSGSIVKRKGQIVDQDGVADLITILAEVPLNDMFGYTTELRTITEVKTIIH